MVRLRLYISGLTPQSRGALALTEQLTREAMPGELEVEIVDLLERPQLARRDGVLVTPTLIRVEPPPVVRLVGSLKDLDHVRRELELDGPLPESRAASA